MNFLTNFPEDIIIEFIAVRRMSYSDFINFFSSDVELRELLHSDSFMTKIEKAFDYPHLPERFIYNARYDKMSKLQILKEAIKLPDNVFIRRQIHRDTKYVWRHLKEFITESYDAHNQEACILFLNELILPGEEDDNQGRKYSSINGPFEYLVKSYNYGLDRVLEYLIQRQDPSIQKLSNIFDEQILHGFYMKMIKTTKILLEYGARSRNLFDKMLKRGGKRSISRGFIDLIDYYISIEGCDNIQLHENNKNFRNIMIEAYKNDIFLSDYDNISCLILRDSVEDRMMIVTYSKDDKLIQSFIDKSEKDKAIIAYLTSDINLAREIDKGKFREYISEINRLPSINILKYIFDNAEAETIIDYFVRAIDDEDEEIVNWIIENQNNLFRENVDDPLLFHIDDYIEKYGGGDGELLSWYFKNYPQRFIQKYRNDVPALLEVVRDSSIYEISLSSLILTEHEKKEVLNVILHDRNYEALKVFIQYVDAKELLDEAYQNAESEGDEELMKILEK